jgi:hypothetical protein
MHRKAEEESALVLGVDRRQRRGAPPGRREPGPPIAGRSYSATTHPGLLRWFDVVTWTEQTIPATPGCQPAASGQFTAAAPVMSGPAGAPLRSGVGLSVVPGGSITPLSAHPVPLAAGQTSPGVGAAPSDAAHWLLPLGRTW